MLIGRIVPIIGTGVLSAGVLGSFVLITTYLIDAYTIYVASALAANTVLRSLMGALLPLAGPRMVFRYFDFADCSFLYWVLDGGIVCLALFHLYLQLFRILFIVMERP